MTPEFKAGLLTGLLACLWITLAMRLGSTLVPLHLGVLTGYGSVLLLVFTQPPLIRHLRTARGGDLSLLRGSLAGLQAALIAALIVCTFLAAYHQVVNPLWLDHALEAAVAHWRAQGVAEPAIRSAIRAIRSAHSPMGLLRGTLPVFTLTGTALALLATRWPRQG